MPFGHQVTPGHDHRGCAGSQGQRSKFGTELVFFDVRKQHALDGRFDNGSAGFTINDQRVIDFLALDHPGSDIHTVDKSEAGVADIEVGAVIAESEVAVHDAGR